MSQAIAFETWDVLVVGAGAAGIASAVAAARNGARVVMVDAAPMIGSELVTGSPVDGCISSRGEWIVGGVVRELFAECDRLGGYIGQIDDYRSTPVVAIDPEIMKVAVVNLVHAAGVRLRLYTYTSDVVVENGRVRGVTIVDKGRRTLIGARIVIDASGDGDVAHAAGAPFEIGDPTNGGLLPPTLMFRMVGVESEPLLRFARDNPENFDFGEDAGRGMSPLECAQALYRRGLPRLFVAPNGPIMRAGVAASEMHHSSTIAIAPTSTARKEVSIVTTHVGLLDAADTRRPSASLPEFVGQVWNCAAFLRMRMPGFENAVFSGLAPWVGIRETRRIVGEYLLSDEDVGEGRKRADGIAKGGCGIDVHRAGASRGRRSGRNRGSYDIPFAALIPRGLANMLVAGRGMSTTRGAHASMRASGTVMATGQAAGTAAALLSRASQWDGDVRAIDVDRLRGVLRSQGAVLEGTE